MPDNSSQLATLDQKIESLDKFATEHSLALLTGGGGFSSAIKVARAMNDLKLMLDDQIMGEFMKLQGSALGFRTDKDNGGGYPVAIVRDVLIEATMKGFQLVANQVNIIGGRFYATKEGFEAFFKKLPQFTDLKTSFGIPKTTAEGCIVACTASWKFKDRLDRITDAQIPIRVNAGQGADAILGKAKRKLLAQIYSRVTGTEISEGDVTDPKGDAAIDVTTTAAPAAAHEPLDEATLKELHETYASYADQVNEYLISIGQIKPLETYAKVSPKFAAKMLKQKASLFETIGIKAKP